MVNNLENGGLKRLCDFEGYSNIQNGYFYNKNSGTFHNGNGTLQALATEKVSILSNFSKKDRVEFEHICKKNLIEGMEVEPFIEMVHVRDSKGNQKRINAFDFKFPYREYSSYVKSYNFYEDVKDGCYGDYRPMIGLKPTNFELKWVCDIDGLPTDILGVALYDVIMDGIPQYTVKLPFLKPSLSDYERFYDHGSYPDDFLAPFYPMLDLGNGRYLFPQTTGSNYNKMTQLRDKYRKPSLAKWDRYNNMIDCGPYILHKGTTGSSQPFIDERWNMGESLEFYEYDVLESTIKKYDIAHDVAVAVLAANGVGALKYYGFEPIPSYRNKDNQARYKEHIEKVMNKYFSLK